MEEREAWERDRESERAYTCERKREWGRESLNRFFLKCFLFLFDLDLAPQ